MEKNEMTLIEKLSNIQTTLKAPKDLKNEYGGWKYRNAEQIEKVAKQVCQDFRTTLIVEDVINMIGDRYYVESVATLHDWDSEKTIVCKASAREQEQQKGNVEAQVTGATSSYARKYCLQGLFLIDDSSDDPDSKDNSNEGQKVYATKEQIEFINKNHSYVLDEFKNLKIKSSRDLAKLSIEQASNLCDLIQQKMMKND